MDQNICSWAKNMPVLAGRLVLCSFTRCSSHAKAYFLIIYFSSLSVSSVKLARLLLLLTLIVSQEFLSSTDSHEGCFADSRNLMEKINGILLH